jgi:DNA-binding NarL/FixJ family response regulator
MDNGKIKLLLADDHELVLKGLKSILEQEKDIEVVAEARNGVEALALLDRTEADMLVTDLKMPDMSGIELTRHVKQHYPQLKVLVLTLFNDREYVNAILEAEAEGYLLKNVEQQELLHAIRHIMNHGTYYSQEIVSILTSELKGRQHKSDTVHDLSKRELEIIGLICQEYSSTEIAEKLFISKSTVDVHRKNILQKTGAKNLVGLIRFAIQHGIVKDFEAG